MEEISSTDCAEQTAMMIAAFQVSVNQTDPHNLIIIKRTIYFVVFLLIETCFICFRNDFIDAF